MAPHRAATAALALAAAVRSAGAFRLLRAAPPPRPPRFGASRDSAVGALSSSPFRPRGGEGNPGNVRRASPSPARGRKLHLSAKASFEVDGLDENQDALTNGKLEQKTWVFREKYPIAYEVASNGDLDLENDDVVPILLLNGFGVGSFHQHSLMRQMLLLEQRENEERQHNRQRYVIYGIDYLGQGQSWPRDCDDGNSADEYDLGYSADMWLDQLKGFIDDVVLIPSSASEEKKVHLVGNSVGGYLATMLASRHPATVASLTLMNATPVWGLNLPGWDGRLPAPALPKLVGRKFFDVIRDLGTIDKYLEAAYVHREAFDGTCGDGFDGDPFNEGTAGQGLGPKIRGCTESGGGHAAFASIMWSGPASDPSVDADAPADFYAALGGLPADVLLLFGDGDPWCTPAVAKRMHATLADRSAGAEAAGRYVALEGVGHCPNHEAPAAVAAALRPWIGASSRRRGDVPLAPADGEGRIREQWGEVRLREVSIEESRDLGLVDRIVSSMVG